LVEPVEGVGGRVRVQDRVNTVLVTGGSGFIGQYVCRELDSRGYVPVVLDRRGNRDAYWETILGDVRDATAVTEAVAHVDGVVHLAAVLGTQETIHNPMPAAETNILGSLNVFEAVAQYAMPAAYICVGNWWMENTYSITKTAAERFSRMFNSYRGTQIAAVRALNAYGPGQALPAPWGAGKVRKIMPTFAALALSGEPIEIYGDGTQIMDMVHVADVAQIMVDALEAGPHPGGLTYEAGTGVALTVTDIADVVAAAAGSSRDHRFVAMRQGEPEGSTVLADVLSLGPLGWRGDDFTSLGDGVGETLDWFRQVL